VARRTRDSRESPQELEDSMKPGDTGKTLIVLRLAVTLGRMGAWFGPRAKRYC
jgi:hypothetical protein